MNRASYTGDALFTGLGYGYGHNVGLDVDLGLVECCEPTVDPLILVGIIGALAGLTFFLQQQGKGSNNGSKNYLLTDNGWPVTCVNVADHTVTSRIL